MKNDALDMHGREVLGFATTMQNLGLAKAIDMLIKMLESEHWLKFVQGGQTFEFLPGEFDYFLTSQGITRDQVMAIRDVETKSRLEEAMDERKTGHEGYRRPILRARAELPRLSGRAIEPFGYTQAERKVLVNGSGHEDGRFSKVHLEALGSSVRRWTNTQGATSRPPRYERPMWERLLTSAVRLDDDDLEALYEELRAERAKRRRRAAKEGGS